MEEFPYDLRLPPAPYRFVWRGEPAVSCQVRETLDFSERRYWYADGTVAIIRQYRLDGSFRVMSDRGEIELIDNARDIRSPDPVSVVRLP